MIFKSGDILELVGSVEKNHANTKEADNVKQADLGPIINYIGDKVDLDITPDIIENVRKDTFEGLTGTYKYILSSFDPREKRNIHISIGLPLLFLIGSYESGIYAGAISTVDIASFLFTLRFCGFAWNPVHYNPITKKVYVMYGDEKSAPPGDKLHEYTHYLQDNFTENIIKKREESVEGLATAIELDGMDYFGYHKKANKSACELLSKAYAKYALKENVSEEDILDALTDINKEFKPKKILKWTKKSERRYFKPRDLPYSVGYTKVKLFEAEVGEDAYPLIFRDISNYNRIKHVSEI